MEKSIITEEKVKGVLEKILNEERSRISRQDFSRIQFKIEELQNSLNETIKEFRKLEDALPNELKTITGKRVNNISLYLNGIQNNINQLKGKIRAHKRMLYGQQIEEKKK